MPTRWFEPVSVRPLERDDIEAVVAIESHEPSAWNSSLVSDELRHKDAVLLVACIDTTVVGWCCGRAQLDEAELFKITVLPQYRRRAVGTELFAVLQEQLRKAGASRLYLEVRSKNEAAVSFYQRAGFTQVGRRIRYYSRPSDDALTFRKDIHNQRNGKHEHEKR